ncbi:MAG: glycosyltransferase [Chloroflexi bacterium]|nr:glycosyltransferase [Chloroflexota bacterium]
MAIARIFSGPVQPYTVGLASGWQRWQYRALVVGWVIAQASFWSWWLHEDHVVTLVGMLINSLLLLWTTFLPAWYLFFLGRARRPNPAVPVPDGRVAMVVTKAPSEPWPVVRKTLEAMLAQDFPRPYDVWLADEDPSPVTLAWCAEHAVQVSSRNGVAAYNNDTWPRRKKCKEGNLAYFYEVMGGYERYEFVSQLDADHVPEPTYLAEMIRPFADPSVGYVAAPSVCDANVADSWAARGRLYSEAAWHGSVQAGFNADFAPQCIGSHYAVRTSALQASGGLGPELAEDFSTTLLMNSNGWRGAFALDAAAHGDGPACVADCITQEFQWSRSVVNIFLSLWANRRDRLPLNVKIQLGFAQAWYFLFTLHMLLVYAMPIVALVTGTPWVDVDLPMFLLRATIPSLVALLALIWTRRQGWLRPATAPVLSWEAILFEYVRWPWMVLGIAHALIGHVTGKVFSFRVTPKGANGPRTLPVSILLPYVAIVVVEAGTAILVEHPGAAIGYTYLALVAALSYVVVIAAMIHLQFRENQRVFSLPRLAQLGAALRVSPLPTFSSMLVGAALVLRGGAVAAAFVPGAAPAGAPNYNGPATDVLRQLATAPQPPATVTMPMDAQPVSVASQPALPTDHLAIGAFDPHLTLTDQPLDVEHWYVPQDDPSLLAGAIAHVQGQRTLLATIEPWPSAGQPANADVLGEVVSGDSDAELQELADIAAADRPQVILVRWGHEMDLANQYPWGAQDPELYKAAFRHVVSVFRAEGADNVRFVWSPAGNANAMDYYPGDDVVDYVGVTVLGDASWDGDFGLPPQSFDDIFGQRYRLVAPLGKPIIIAEMGVSGTVERQTTWLSAARQSMAAYPLLEAAVYFDDRNSAVNHQQPVQPDWTLSGTSLAAFMDLGSVSRDAVSS